MAGVLVALYPVIVYVALTRLGPRSSAALVFVMVLVVGIGKNLFNKTGFKAMLLQVFGVGVLALATALFDDPVYLMQLPVLISIFLAVTFAVTLFRPPSMIERYALMVDSELSPAERRHCLITTYVWLVFLVMNASTAEVLALSGRPDWWAMYSGFLAYILMGLMFAGEYVIRKARFKKFGRNPLDLLLARISGCGDCHDRESGGGR